MSRIHPTAIVAEDTVIADDVEIGPYAVIESGVTVGPGCRFGPYVHLQGELVMGANNSVGTGTQLGQAPQHLHYAGEPKRLVIGDGNVIREYASIHGSWEKGGATRIGNGCFIMGQCHIGHDCVIDDGAVISNGALISGHIHIGSRTIVSGPVGIHQFVRIGRLCMLGAFAGAGRDIPPFMIIEGRPAFIRGLNSIGLRRAGVSSESRAELRRVFRMLYRDDRPPKEVAIDLRQAELGAEARELVDFYAEPSGRGFTPFKAYRSHAST